MNLGMIVVMCILRFAKAHLTWVDAHFKEASGFYIILELVLLIKLIITIGKF